MTSLNGYLVLVVSLAYVAEFQSHAKGVDIHGGIPMGVSNDQCDNARWNLNLDWDDSTNMDYMCQPDEQMIPANTHTRSRTECQAKDEQPAPIHYCMNRTITYQDQPPRAGPHRPLWPVYGEYVYVPPQRWIHTMEHGSAVFLYHPCADPEEVQLLREVASNCIRRRIFTPYRNMTVERPFAVVTYGCRLSLGHVDVGAIKDYIREFAMNPAYATETAVYRDGQYSKGLLRKANVVSDIQDSELCPENIEERRNADYLNAGDMDASSYLMSLLKKLDAGK